MTIKDFIMNEQYCSNVRCSTKIAKKHEQFKCAHCGELFCGRHIYSYVDESNEAITKNSPELCARCYVQEYR